MLQSSWKISDFIVAIQNSLESSLTQMVTYQNPILNILLPILMNYTHVGDNFGILELLPKAFLWYIHFSYDLILFLSVSVSFQKPLQTLN